MVLADSVAEVVFGDLASDKESDQESIPSVAANDSAVTAAGPGLDF